MQVPAPFQYERATTVEHALTLLMQLGVAGEEARILAGGHSLLPMMKLRLAAPEYLIDIDALADELGYVRLSKAGDEILIGAMVRHRQLLESSLLRERAAIFADAERVIADPVVRNRGTIGGAVCQADPSEDLSAVCAAVGARMVIRGLEGERVVEMAEFNLGPYRTSVAPDEMLVEIRVPVLEDTGSAYEKLDRRAGDWAVAAAAAMITLAPDGTVARAGIALTAVGADTTCPAAEASLMGETPGLDQLVRAADLAAASCSPVTDQRGSAEYKRHAAGILATRALARAAARAAGGRD